MRQDPNTNRTILIVDDDSGIRESLSEALNDFEFDTVTAGNGREALSCLNGPNPLPCAILLDIMMPVMDGWTFLEQRKLHENLRDIPVLILSANATFPDISVWGASVRYLRKPVDLDPLVEVVREMTGQH